MGLKVLWDMVLWKSVRLTLSVGAQHGCGPKLLNLPQISFQVALTDKRWHIQLLCAGLWPTILATAHNRLLTQDIQILKRIP